MAKANNAPKLDYTPVEYDPQYILQVNALKKYFPIKGDRLPREAAAHVGRVCRPLWPLVGLGCPGGVQFCLPHETDRALSRPGTYCTLSEHDIAWSRKSGLLRNHAKAVAGGLG